MNVPAADPPSSEGGAFPRGTILVPLDGSPTARAILPLARAAATLLEVPVHLLHVTDVPVSPAELLRMVHLGPQEIEGTILEQRHGDVADAILQEAAAHNTRLIVTTTHGWTTSFDLPVGPVAEAVLRRAECSLLLVRAEIAQQFTEERRSLDRILIPLDGTPETASALAPAAEMAARSGARLDVLHVATPGPKPAEHGALSVPRYVDNPSHEWEAWRDEFSSRFLRPFGSQAANLEVAAGDPSTEILRASREQRTDLVVLVWKGQLAVDRAPCVKTMLKESPCPLLFLRTRPSLELPPGVVEVRASP
jgi:nucleotide-binding universal stress UspA family protein